MTRYLTFAVAIRIMDAERIGPLRDAGLLKSALDRPATTIFGNDAYPDLATKAGALLHSVCANHALVDGNKRLAAILALVFLDLNGARSALDNDGLFDLTMAVASGSLVDAAEIATRLVIARRD